jgi:sugar lactone lactonase YvrE/NAD(P)-dependent dehydrogenase (short-subunit alcohol dehydrogenase family)
MKSLDNKIELILDAKAVLGESPIWVEEQGALYWIDVRAPALHRTELNSRATNSWNLPSEIGGYALYPDGKGAIVGLRSGVFGLRFSDGALKKLYDPPFDPRTHRFNEGDCDPSGRLWLGTMFDPQGDASSKPVKGCLYSLTHGGGLVKHEEPSLLHNGFAWSPDGKQFVFAHSREGRIYACNFDLVRGRLRDKKVFAEVAEEIGVPDGGAFDAEGCYWSAIHGGGRLHRYAPDGTLDRVVELPVRNPTMVAFCGPDLRDLCITSATHGKPCRPHEGGIFRLRPGVTGLARRSHVAPALSGCAAVPGEKRISMMSARTVVVTGASAGVGRAIALAFGEQKWQVALIARGEEGLASAARDVEAAGGRALAIRADVADADAIMQAADRVETELGRIDVWVNNAMVTIYANIASVTPAEFDQVTRVTYLGQVHGTLAALKHMRPRNRGVIICIGSALAYRSIPFQGPYCAAKAAVRGFVDSLRCELLYEHSNVRLTLIHLPAVNTPQFDWARNKLSYKVAPVKPIFQPETVGDAVVRAVHETPREYWLGHSTVKAIMAQMLAPSIADRYLAKGGKRSETTNQMADQGRPDNLFEAGQGDPGTHGRFDNRSSPRAFPFNPAWLRAAGALIALAGGAALVSAVAACRRDR